MVESIKSLECACLTTEEYGNKAVNLSKLNSVVSVPKGIAIGKSSYKINNFESAVQQALCKIPIVGKRYCIRSSSSKEDGQKTYAGMLRSEVNVSEEELFESIDRVKKSYSNIPENYDNSNHSIIPVVVQEYLDFDIGGVCFTRHPVTNEKVYYIEMDNSPKEVVSGNSIPTTLHLEKNKNYTGLENLLKRTFEKIDKIYSRPQDIEWGCVNDTVFVVQTRDITTL